MYPIGLIVGNRLSPNPLLLAPHRPVSALFVIFCKMALVSLAGKMSPALRSPLAKLARVGFIFLLASWPSKALCAEGNSASNKPKNFKDWFSKLTNKQSGTSTEEVLFELPEVLHHEWQEGTLSAVKKSVDDGAPVQVGYGFLMGYSSGFCLKKVSKVASFALGGVFILLQTLSYTGHIQIDYVKVQKDIERTLDFNNDGKLDEEDAKVVYDKVYSTLSHQMPAGGGFAAGMFLGLRA